MRPDEAERLRADLGIAEAALDVYVARLAAAEDDVGPAEDPRSGEAFEDERCECCGRTIAAGDEVAVFFEDDGSDFVMHWGPCPPPALWFTAWTYSTGERSDSRHRPVPFEVAFYEAHRWRKAGGKSLALVTIRRWREEVPNG